MRNLQVGLSPVNKTGLAYPFMYYTLGDGANDGTSILVAQNRAFGSGAIGPDLGYIAGAAGSLWTTQLGAADFPDSGSSLFAADLDAATAAAFSLVTGNEVLLVWAYGTYDVNADTGFHTILQVGNGANSLSGFEFGISQVNNRIELRGRVNGEVSEDITWAVSSNSSLASGTAKFMAAYVDFSVFATGGGCFVNGTASNGGAYGPTSAAMTLDASASQNKVAVGGSYSGGVVAASRTYDGIIQRVGAVLFPSMPTHFTDIVTELSDRKGVPGRRMMAA